MRISSAGSSSITSRPAVHLRNADGICTRILLDDSRLDAQDWRQEFCYSPPTFTLVIRSIELAASRAKVEAHWIERVRRKRIAEHREKSVPVGKPLAERFPRHTGVARAPHPRHSIRRHPE